MSFRQFTQLVRRYWPPGTYRVRYQRHEAGYAAFVIGRNHAAVTVIGGPYQTTGRIYWRGTFVGLAD
jgi:hypothetical protein